jgi:hypothetical protein
LTSTGAAAWLAAAKPREVCDKGTKFVVIPLPAMESDVWQQGAYEELPNQSTLLLRAIDILQ